MQVVIEAPHHDDLSQQDGFFHACTLTTAADSGSGYAAYSMLHACGTSLQVR